MSEKINLTECCTQEGAKLASPGVVQNVKIIGRDSKRGRRYDCLEAAVGLYEGAKVNLNHPSEANPKADRNIVDRFGKITGVSFDGSANRGTIQYNPKHPYAPAFEWFVENMPDAISLSHNAVGSGRSENGVMIVEQIHQVRSVDLVADGASNQSLFESYGAMQTAMNGGGAEAPQSVMEMGPPGGGDPYAYLGKLVEIVFNDPDLDDKQTITFIKMALKMSQQLKGGDASPKPESTDAGDDKANPFKPSDGEGKPSPDAESKPDDEKDEGEGGDVPDDPKEGASSILDKLKKGKGPMSESVDHNQKLEDLAKNHPEVRELLESDRKNKRLAGARERCVRLGLTAPSQTLIESVAAVDEKTGNDLIREVVLGKRFASKDVGGSGGASSEDFKKSLFAS